VPFDHKCAYEPAHTATTRRECGPRILIASTRKQRARDRSPAPCARLAPCCWTAALKQFKCRADQTIRMTTVAMQPQVPSARWATGKPLAHIDSGVGSSKALKVMHLERVPMRTLALIVLGVGTTFTLAEAPAQTYGGSYPVCLHVWDYRGYYVECAYTSMAQCAGSASGRAAQCMVNPYFANPHRIGRAHRGQRQFY